MRLQLTRRITFHASHRMHKPGWSEAESARRFGWTAAAPGHGHLYRIAVTVTGEPDPETGTVIDLGVLDAVLEDRVRGVFEGQDLNTVLPEVLSGRAVPSCEVMAAEIWRRVTDGVPAGVSVVRVVVAEDDTLEAECLSEG
ncbi:MAG TPA: 6-carboxytetrahydropterin synthase [Gemmatimonadales bacterium]|nr:6-carboxytetrahydropterin synthase [Gemmatimonadales bacterium]